MKFILLSLLPLAHAVVTELSTQQFFEGIQANKFQVIVDVRSQAEFDAGHIEGAFSMENLFYFGMGSLESSTPADLEGCELCHIAVYDRSGGRTINAIKILEQAGFMNLYNGQGSSQWTLAGYPLVTDASVMPPCASDPAAQDQCSMLEEAPTASPTVNDPALIRTVDAPQFVQLRNRGVFDVILDVREGETCHATTVCARPISWILLNSFCLRLDKTGGHITGATLIGPLTEDNLSELDGCDYCNIALYGEGAQDAADLLMENEFGGRMYLGPSVEEYADAGFALSSAESIEPRCTTDSVIQEACEARYLDDGGDAGGSSGAVPPSAPSTSNVPEPAPVKAPSNENTPEEDITTPPTSPTSGILFISAMLSYIIIGVSTVFLL